MSGKQKLKQVSGETAGFKGAEMRKRPSPQLKLTTNLTSSVTPVKPVSIHCEGESLAEKDRRCALNILPEEVWHLVFEEVDDCGDLENISNSSLFFRELLAPQRTKFLFKNVLHNLAKPLDCEKKDSIEPEFSLSEDDPAYVDKRVTAMDLCRDFLNLRLVCRVWSTAVDNVFDHHSLHLDVAGENKDFVSIFLTKNAFITNTEYQPARSMIQHFAETHENTKRNPFLGRTLQIGFVDIDEDNELNFYNDIIAVIRKYGQHVWHSNIQFESFQLKVKCYSRIRDILQLMPNLKVNHVYVHQEEENAPSANELNELQVEINARPLPSLPKMQMLLTCNLLPSVFTELLRTSSRLKKLTNILKNHRFSYDVSKVALPDLEKLEIIFCSQVGFLGMDILDWKLKELDLNFEFCADFIGWQQVFDLIEKIFKNTLTKLYLTLPVAVDKVDKEKIYRDGCKFQLKLPHLKSFYLRMNNLSCLDFLLPMKNSICDLQITVTLTSHANIIRPLEKVEAGGRSILKLLSCVRQPCKSNIWTLFPQLKKVYYKVVSSEYEISCYSTNKSSWVVNEQM